MPKDDPVLTPGQKASDTRYAAARGLRGLLQVSFAEALISFVQAFNIAQFTEAQHAALLLLISPVLAFIQNWLEARGSLPGMAKPEGLRS